jgi:carboxyl-terminal processing protease
VDLALAGVDRLILDLRGSDGGTIDHAMLIASRFVPSTRVVAQLSARGPTGLSPAGEVMVSPLPTGTFAGRVVVLVGPGTIGVAELLVAAIGDLDGVTVIGQPTAGSAGPGMVRFLPNGWSVGFPNLQVTLGDGSELVSGMRPDLVSVDPLLAAVEMLGG